MNVSRHFFWVPLACATLTLAGCSGGGSPSSNQSTQTQSIKLSVAPSGNGSGVVTSGDGKINCGTTCTANYSDGATVTLTAAPSSGSTFGGWSGGGCTGTATTCTVTVSAADTVTANFITTGTTTYTLTVSDSGTGLGKVTSSDGKINCGATCSATYTDGATITLTAAPSSGSTFDGWSGGGCPGTTATCTVTVVSAETVTANFVTTGASTYTLTASDSGSGLGVITSSDGKINCGSSCSASYSSGTQVTLTATPNSGNTFAGWSGGTCSGTSTSCTVTMSAAVTATASFSPSTPPPSTYTLAVSIPESGGQKLGFVGSNTSPFIDCGSSINGGSGTVGIVCSATYNSGTQVTLTETPLSGDVFGGWSGGGCSGTATTCTVIMNQAVTVTATFTAPASQTVTLSPADVNYIATSSSTNAASTVYKNEGVVMVGEQFEINPFGGCPLYTDYGSLVSFDINGAGLTGKTIDSATLTLTTDGVNIGGTYVEGFKTAVLSSVWYPDSVTWTSAGSLLVYNNGWASGTEWENGDAPTSNGEVYTVNATSLVQNWVNGSFASNGLLFMSSEYTTCGVTLGEIDAYELNPRLTVNYH